MKCYFIRPFDNLAGKITKYFVDIFDHQEEEEKSLEKIQIGANFQFNRPIEFHSFEIFFNNFLSLPNK